MGIRDKPISAGSPWQNCFTERLIGTIRRECLAHLIVLGEAHLCRVLGEFAAYYNKSRTHRDAAEALNRPMNRGVLVQSWAMLQLHKALKMLAAGSN
jgi:hypothetical protein